MHAHKNISKNSFSSLSINKKASSLLILSDTNTNKSFFRSALPPIGRYSFGGIFIVSPTISPPFLLLLLSSSMAAEGFWVSFFRHFWSSWGGGKGKEEEAPFPFSNSTTAGKRFAKKLNIFIKESQYNTFEKNKKMGNKIFYRKNLSNSSLFHRRFIPPPTRAVAVGWLLLG